MQEQLISYKTAVLAKEKGWNGDFIESHKILTNQSLLQKWLREVHNCIIEVTFYGENIESVKDIKYEVEIDYYGKNFNLIGNSSDYISNGYDTFEEALEVGLLEGLKLIP